MKVYVVIDNAPEKYIRQIFSDEEKAKKYISQDVGLNDGISTCYIEEQILDVAMTVLPKGVKGEAFIRFIDKWDVVDGNWIKTIAGRVYDSTSSLGRRRLARPADTYDYIGFNYKNEGVKVFSFESQDHAKDIAKKLYEDYLRKREETPPIY